MDLSIIIVNFNTRKLLRECLQSISHSEGISRSEHQQPTINYEIIVVDNGSTDGSVEMVKKLIKKNKLIKLIENKKNLGFAKANNQGIRKAKGKYILLLNSDTILKNNPLLKLIRFAEKHPQAGVVGCKLLSKDGSKQPSVAPFFTLPKLFLWLLTGDRFLYSSPQKPCQVDWVMGAALMAKKEVVEKIGLLDEKFFMYMEEAEWCYRIKKAGWQVWFYPEAEIFHLIRGSSPSGKQRAILGIYKGLIYFYQKHFAPRQLSMLKFLLRAKAAGAWFVGILTNNAYLRQTYAKAFKMVYHV